MDQGGSDKQKTHCSSKWNSDEDVFSGVPQRAVLASVLFIIVTWGTEKEVKKV